MGRRGHAGGIGGEALTDVTSGNWNLQVRLVGQQHASQIRLQRRPAAKEDAKLELVGVVALLSELLLLCDQGAADQGAFGVADDSIERAMLLDNLHQVV